MVVASQFDGRVRIRDEGLKKEPLLAKVKEALLAMPGVSGVEGNPRVGSLLILYSAAVTGMEKIMKTVADLVGSGEVEGEPAEAGGVFARVSAKVPFSIPAKVKRNVANIGMLGALLLSVAAAIFDLKKLHILAGIVFLALFGSHVFERKEYLIV